jgi:curved DNA-binding protein CbpA
MQETRNPYEILMVRETATDLELKKTYRDLAAKHHPDKHSNGPDQLRRMQDINWAWGEVSTPERRKETDARLEAMRPKAPPPRAAPTYAPPPPPIRVQHQRSDLPWGAILAAGLGIGLAAIFGGSASRAKWDPSVQRYRGRDGRFVGD